MSYITRQPRGAVNPYPQYDQPELQPPSFQQRYYRPPPAAQPLYPNESVDIGDLAYPPSPPGLPQNPPVYAEAQKPESKETPSFEEAFVISMPKWNDIWAAILFSLVCLGFLAVSGLAISGYKNVKNGSSKHAILSMNTNISGLFALIIAIAFLISLGYFIMVRYLTKQIIYITAVLQVVIGLATTIAYFAMHWYSAGVICLLFTLFYVVCFFSWRKRIPFSVLMLQTVIDVSKSYGHMFAVSALGGLAVTAFAVYFSVTLVGIYAKYQPGGPSCGADGKGCSAAKVAGLTVFSTFAAFWITEVMKNLIHVTVSGIYGSWYFCSQKPGGFPRGATRGAFTRASTYSFGSISFGSLIVAIMQFLRQLCSVLQAEEMASGNILGIVLSCFAGFFISVLDWIMEFINEYAFSYIALYGKAYIPAAKDTWRMLRSRGIDALTNHCIVNPVLTMGSVFVAYICAFIAFLYMEATKKPDNSKGSYTAIVMAMAFLLGLQICHAFLVPIKSGLSTFFVAMAFDPQVLEKDFPDLYQQMVVLHPQVQECVKPGA